MALFGKKPPRDVRQLVAGLAVPAVHIAKQDGPGVSHFGGAPNLPPGVAWPERDGVRLGFLARLSLAEIRRAAALDWLPADGALLFFYDMENQPWGFDPKDRGAWAVIRVPDLTSPVEADDVAGDDGPPIALRAVGFGRLESWPGPERDAITALELSDEEAEAFHELRSEGYGGSPAHHVGGYPDAVQGDYMELESQLASNGIYTGDPSGYEGPRAKALEPGAADWRLLFQFDTDDDLNVMWGDCGMVYFWVRAEDARKGDFTGAWLILQCS